MTQCHHVNEYKKVPPIMAHQANPNMKSYYNIILFIVENIKFYFCVLYISGKRCLCLFRTLLPRKWAAHPYDEVEAPSPEGVLQGADRGDVQQEKIVPAMI